MNYSSLVKAFLGDSVFELKIREYFIAQGLAKVDQLTKECSKYASAKGHFKIMKYLLENNKLSEAEIKVYKAGRNAKVNQRRKNFNSENYHASTGFEALIGNLYLENNNDRINEIIKIIVCEDVL